MAVSCGTLTPLPGTMTWLMVCSTTNGYGAVTVGCAAKSELTSMPAKSASTMGSTVGVGLGVSLGLAEELGDAGLGLESASPPPPQALKVTASTISPATAASRRVCFDAFDPLDSTIADYRSPPDHPTGTRRLSGRSRPTARRVPPWSTHGSHRSPTARAGPGRSRFSTTCAPGARPSRTSGGRYGCVRNAR